MHSAQGCGPVQKSCLPEREACSKLLAVGALLLAVVHPAEHRDTGRWSHSCRDAVAAVNRLSWPC